MSDVFISYASEDRPQAKRLAAALEASGLCVWWDRQIIVGQSYDDVIEHELESTKSVVVLWSKCSVASEWVKSEAQVAMERGMLVPALIEVVKPPLEFRRKQTADLVGWDGDPVHAGYHTLRRGIAAHIGRETPAQPPDPPETRPAKLDAQGASETPARVRTPHLLSAPRALLWRGAAALLILLLLGLGVWDAFYRTHVDYYANVIKRHGVPEGIGKLSAEQLRHRNVSLAFSRKGRSGPVREIRAINQRGAYPPQFAYFPPLSLLALYRFPDMKLTTCRVTFDYDKGVIVRESAYERGDRLLYALHYPRPDIAEYQVDSSQMASASGITRIRIVRSETGPEAGLDKDILFQDGTDTARPDDHGRYGYRNVFDKFGLVREELALGANGQPSPNRLGVAKETVSHDELGNQTKSMALGPDGRHVADEHGIAETRARHDQYGNLTELAFFGADGQLVTSPLLGAAVRTMAYDGQGNIVENGFFGPGRQLVIGVLGFARQKVAWDDSGGSLESYFGADGKPTLITERVVKIKASWDKRGYLVEAAYLDENERPVRNAAGCAKSRIGRDEHGNAADIACLDEGDQPVRDTSGAARFRKRFDQRGNLLEESYFGPDGAPALYEENYVKTRWKYNPQGKLTELAYFDAADKPVRNRNGFASVKYVYDTHGNQHEIASFDEKGQSTLRKGGYAKLVRDYDVRENVIEETELDTGGKPVRDEDGYAKTRFTYDTRGYRVETSYYDENDRPVSNESGCIKIRNKTNDIGQLTQVACLGRDGNLVASKYGMAIFRQTFGAGGKLAQVDYHDANDAPVQASYGYARIRYSYDQFGREIRREFFDVNGQPVLTHVTIEKAEPDGKGQRVGLRAWDMITAYEGQEVPDGRRWYELELMLGERPRQLSIVRAGKNVTLDVPAGRLKGITVNDMTPAAVEKRRQAGQGKAG